MKMRRLTLAFLGISFQSTLGQVTTEDAIRCNADVPAIDFLVLEGDANAEAIEDEVRTDLEKIGLKINTRLLSKNDYNAERAAGTFGISFSETWGPPYDPHSYASAWVASDNANHNAFVNLTAPSSRTELLDMIEDVLQEEDETLRESKWVDIHHYYHEQAVMLPLWGRRVVAIINSRISGYQEGHQQFDFPVHKLRPTGNKNVTISPGALTGRFETIGNLDPHTYNPNEFFANNWVYEGLVRYGPNGDVLPALAKDWDKVDLENGGVKYTFHLRQDVKFHDGTDWNCAAAKMNLDHVFAGALREPFWHGWYGVPKYINDWSCEDEKTLVMSISTKFYPFLQELTFIRPIRFLSPEAFAEGNTSDPFTANSCEPGWTSETPLEQEGSPPVTCKGISNMIGTGPFSFVSRDEDVLTSANFDETRIDNNVIFKANEEWWDGPIDIDYLKVIRYNNAEEIESALLDGSLDVMWGDGVLPSKSISNIENTGNSNLNVFIGEDLQNVLLLFNTGTPPLDDIRIRKTVIHAIDKDHLVRKELGGFTDPVDNLFSRSLPYCDVDLTPHWDYDLEKAVLLSCENESTDEGGSSNDDSLAIGLGVGFGVLSLISIGVALNYARKAKDLEAKYVSSQGVSA